VTERNQRNVTDIDLTIPAVLDRSGGNVADFKPHAAKASIAKADALIDLARKLMDWPLLETAVDAKIEQQDEFVRWWRENVTPNRHSLAPDRKPRTAFSVDDAEKQTGLRQQQVSKWAKRLTDKKKYRATLYEAAWRKAMAEKGQTDQRGASGTGENEWYTPDAVLDAARDVLGEIDLDPASSEAAQAKVKAKAFFTKEDDGLAHDWHGRVWLNPPYAQPHIADFASKMVAERRAGNVTAAIMLTHNYTDTTWFHEAAGCADAICFTRGRIRFYDTSGELASPTQGQAFFYFGDDVDGFAERFASVGFVVTPYTGEVA
jgi:phage N-6-adenine-methyltransferase